MPVHVLAHPLVAHRLAEVRATTTGAERFRQLVSELAGMLAYEAARALPTIAVTVDTPLGTADGARLASPDPLVVPILRAGLGMLDATIGMLPTATVALLGLRRDERTLQPQLYCDTLPAVLEGRRVLLLDPMLATGGSLAFACDHVRARGAAALQVCCIVAAPEGLRRLEETFPEVEVWTAAVDPQLNDVGYIFPGLGDAGDRLYGELD